MKVARVAVLGVALGAGVVAAVLALNLTTPPPTAEPARAVEAPTMATVDVLVAAKDLGLGRPTEAASFAWKAWPKDGVSSVYITKADRPNAATELVGTIARSTFFVGEPITETKLVHADRGFLSAILPAGKRAVAIKISANTSAGGFILPNDHVDVIMTRKISDKNGGGDRFQTETILSDVRVLAIDQQIEDKNGDKVVVGQTATVELTPEQAEIITVGQQINEQLTLALRSLADAEAGKRSPDAMHLIGGPQKGGGVTVVKNGVSRQVGAN
ncbi:MAG: Flp pilus assembly protein CpaB [Bauldia sp.]